MLPRAVSSNCDKFFSTKNKYYLFTISPSAMIVLENPLLEDTVVEEEGSGDESVDDMEVLILLTTFIH